jgi:hypothetical protein
MAVRLISSLDACALIGILHRRLPAIARAEIGSADAVCIDRK